MYSWVVLTGALLFVTAHKNTKNTNPKSQQTQIMKVKIRKQEYTNHHHAAINSNRSISPTAAAATISTPNNTNTGNIQETNHHEYQQQEHQHKDPHSQHHNAPPPTLLQSHRQQQRNNSDDADTDNSSINANSCTALRSITTSAMPTPTAQQSPRRRCRAGRR